MAEPEIVVERRAHAAIITLNRPAALNALTVDMMAAFNRAVAEAEADPEVTAVIVTGAGRGFCSGLDAGVLADAARTGDRRLAERGIDPDFPAQFGQLIRVSKPVIAAVNGVAVGMGLVLALLCDLRFAAEEASFATIFSRRGLIAEHGTSWLLPRVVGPSRALDLLWSSRRIDAAEAYRIGLVDRLTSGADLLPAAEAYVAELAAGVSPHAMAVIKDMVWRHLDADMASAVGEADRTATASLAHPDVKEGVAAMVERRPPRFRPWTGRGT